MATEKFLRHCKIATTESFHYSTANNGVIRVFSTNLDFSQKFVKIFSQIFLVCSTIFENISTSKIANVGKINDLHETDAFRII